MPKELAERPILRNELTYLWVLFVSLKNASSGVISYTQIKDYMAIYGNLSPFEVDAVRSLDLLHSKENKEHG